MRAVGWSMGGVDDEGSTTYKILKNARVRCGWVGKAPRSQSLTPCMFWLRLCVLLGRRGTETRAHETMFLKGKNTGKHTPRDGRLEPNQRLRPSQPSQIVYSYPWIDERTPNLRLQVGGPHCEATRVYTDTVPVNTPSTRAKSAVTLPAHLHRRDTSYQVILVAREARVTMQRAPASGKGLKEHLYLGVKTGQMRVAPSLQTSTETPTDGCGHPE